MVRPFIKTYNHFFWLRILFFFIIGLLNGACSLLLAQTNLITQLETALANNPTPEKKFELTRDLATAYSKVDKNKARQLWLAAINLLPDGLTEEQLSKFYLAGAAIYMELDEVNDSIKLFLDEAQLRIDSTKHKKQLAQLYLTQSDYHHKITEYGTARTLAFKAVDIYQALGEKKLEGNAVGKVAGLIYYTNDYEKMIKYCDEALAIHKEFGPSNEMSDVYQDKALALLVSGDYDTALEVINKAIDARSQVESSIYKIRSDINMRGNIYKYRSEYDLAIADYTENMEIFDSLNYIKGVIPALGNLGHVYNLKEAYAKSIPYLKRELAMIEATGHLKYRNEVYYHLANAYAGIEDYPNAYTYQLLRTDAMDDYYMEALNDKANAADAKYMSENRHAKLMIQEQQLVQQRTTLGLILAILGVISIAGFLLYRLVRQLRKSNQEKEFLLKEIHHRVKNNLQMLSSLLNLQSRFIKDENAFDAVQEGRNRVQSMGLIHQKLYMGENLTSVNMKDYLMDLGENLMEALKIEDKQIQINYQVDNLNLDAETAIPVGLILNELITNSLKYAFPSNQKGKIDIQLGINREKHLYLKVADNGEGNNHQQSRNNSTSFGSSLIKILSKKLKGTIEIFQDNGYSTAIEFKNFKIATR